MEPIVLVTLGMVVYGGWVTLRDLLSDLGREELLPRGRFGRLHQSLRDILAKRQLMRRWLPEVPQTGISFRSMRCSPALSYSGAHSRESARHCKAK
jgi:hypothetical protein